jgi:putative spermidine/putrescine transport system permease protein
MSATARATTPTAAGQAGRAGPGRLRMLARDWGPGLPLILLGALALIAPIVATAVDSVIDDRTGAWTLQAWEKTFSSSLERRGIGTSVALAGACATVATAIGAPLAWFISRMAGAGNTFWVALMNVASNFGGIGLGFAYVATLGTTGMLTILLSKVGLEGLAPERDSFLAFVLAFAYVNVPLYVLLVLPSMGVVRDEWWDAAQASAATRRQFWRYVSLPVLAPFALMGWLLVFTWSMGTYATAYALAGGAGADFQLITLSIGQRLQSSVFGLDRAAALSILLLAIAGVALAVYRVVARRARRWL